MKSEHLDTIVSEKYNSITRLLITSGTSITTMESCTSGTIASLLTDTEGSSSVFEGADITYSNSEKLAAGVDASVIDKFGVYSEETARAMAIACRQKRKTDVGIGITGSFANVDPANKDSIPGEVDAAIAIKNNLFSFHITLPSGLSRHESKLYVADLVADELLKLM